jgi:hypothetical protein
VSGDINGTGMDSPQINEPSGAVTSREATRKNPTQGRFKSGVNDQRALTRIDTNKHGIRRETTLGPKPKKGKPKKV